MNLPKLLILIGCHGNQNIRFAKKYSVIFSSIGISGMKLKLQEMFITLASTKITFFVAIAYVLLLLWQLYFNRLIMGK